MTVRGGGVQQEDARGTRDLRRESLTECALQAAAVTPLFSATDATDAGTATATDAAPTAVLEGQQQTAGTLWATAQVPTDPLVRTTTALEIQDGAGGTALSSEGNRTAEETKAVEWIKGRSQPAAEVTSIFPLTVHSRELARVPLLAPTETLAALSALSAPPPESKSTVTPGEMSSAKENLAPSETEIQLSPQNIMAKGNTPEQEGAPDIRQLSRLIQALPTKEDI